MTESEWLNYAKENKDKLRNFIENYHPRARLLNAKIGNTVPLPITASGPEYARNQVIGSILLQEQNDLHPILQFDLAFMQDDIEGLNKILNSAWFGVPESTLCWNIEGFTEAVRLMEDVPE